MNTEQNPNEPLLDESLEEVAGGAAGQVPMGATIYNRPVYPYPWTGPVVWPPVDPNTASGLPPMIPPGAPPPGY